VDKDMFIMVVCLQSWTEDSLS